MARASSTAASPAPPAKVSFLDRLRQIRSAFLFTQKHDRLLVPLLLAAVLVPIVLAVALSWVFDQWLTILPFGIMLALVAGLLLFSRRAMSATYAEIEGRPGAAVGILQSMRGDWRITPAVQVSTAQDMVHRVVGRPGVILIGEGPSSRLRALLGQERKKISRVLADVPVYTVVVGDDEGQVSIRKLQQHVYKLPRNVTGKQVNAVDKRLQAIGGMNVPMPKGPMPKGARMPKAPRAARR